MSAIGLEAGLAVAATLALVPLRRAGAGPLWIAGWSMLLAGAAARGLGAGAPALAALLGSLGPALLLAGSRAYAGRRRLAWLLPAGVAVGGARAAAAALGFAEGELAAGALFDPALVAAAALTARSAGGVRPTAVERMLPGALGAVALLELAGALLGQPLLRAWAVVAPATWVLQTAALSNRVAAASARERDQRFRALTENVRELVAELDAEGRILYASDRHAGPMVPDPAALVGRLATDLFRGAQRERARAWIERCVRGEETEPVVWSVSGEGGERFFESAMRGFRTASGERHVVVSTRDVTEARRIQRELEEAQRELESRVEERTRALAQANVRLAREARDRERADRAVRTSEARYRRITGLCSDWGYAARILPDGSFRMEWLSESFPEKFGYSIDEVQRGFRRRIAHPDDWERIARQQSAFLASGDGSVVELEYRLFDKRGELHWVRERMLMERPAEGDARVFGAGLDVTDGHRAEAQRLRLEARLAEAERRASLGLMAGGIAHDFNNLLMPILGHSVMALEELPGDSPARPRLQRIRRAAELAGGLVRQLLTFAGRGTTGRETFDLSPLVGEIVGLVDAAAARPGRIETELAGELPPLRGDPTQVRQVALNLITNAAEALGAEGGTVRVRTAVTFAGADLLSLSVLGDDPPPGHYLLLEVCDDGCGMDSDTRRRIFDPFFTTKFSGRGLGLAAVLGIVRGHGGAILVESERARGTRIRVLFPVADGAPALREDPPPVGAPLRPATVLVVDDEEPVREIAGEYLERAGLRVLHAESGEAARARLAECAGAVDAVLLDLVMPEEDGEALLAWLEREHPSLPVVLASGHSEEQVAARVGGRVSGFVQKPYVPEALLEAMARALPARLSAPARSSGSPAPG